MFSENYQNQNNTKGLMKRATLLAKSHKLDPQPLDEGPRPKSGLWTPFKMSLS